MSAGYGTEEAVLIGGGGASAAKKKSSVTGGYVPYAITLIAGIFIGLIAVHVSGTSGSQRMGTFFNRDTILDRSSADQNLQPGQVGKGKSEEGEGGVLMSNAWSPVLFLIAARARPTLLPALS